MAELEPKYRLIVTELLGWKNLDRPTATANSPRSDIVGKMRYAYEIISFDGVAYACLVPTDPTKVEWGRVAEQGGVLFDDNGNYLKQVKGVHAYVKVIPLVNNDSLLIAVIRELVSAIATLSAEIRAAFSK